MSFLHKQISNNSQKNKATKIAIHNHDKLAMNASKYVIHLVNMSSCVKAHMGSTYWLNKSPWYIFTTTIISPMKHFLACLNLIKQSNACIMGVEWARPRIHSRSHNNARLFFACTFNFFVLMHFEYQYTILRKYTLCRCKHWYRIVS